MLRDALSRLRKTANKVEQLGNKKEKENAMKIMRKIAPMIDKLESEETSSEEEEETPKLEIITRQQWAAQDARTEELKYFRKKPELVRVCSTGTPTCDGFLDCCAAVQHMQTRDFDESLPDIKYNFVVSSDGLVFEGRSWKVIPHIQGQRYKSRCLLFGIIGEFLNYMPPKDSLRSIGTLLTNAVVEKHVDRQFKILPFQTFKKPINEKPEASKISFSEFEDFLTDWELFEE